MSLWLRNIPVPPEHRARLRRRQQDAVLRTSAANRRRLVERTERIQREAVVEVGPVSERDLFIAGVVMYAAEGAKEKPWKTAALTSIINSDPRVIRLFLRWLQLLGIDVSDLAFRVCIHEAADVGAALEFWANVVSVPASRFMRTTLKRGNPKTRRRNTGDSYRGCLVITVRRSIDLTRRIAGWFHAIADGCGEVNRTGFSVPQPALGPKR